MTPRRHLTFVLDDADLPAIAEQRRRWDPVMARGVPPHVTLVYPEEVTGERALRELAHRLAARSSPFSMSFGTLTAHDHGAGGVFVPVHDASGTWDDLRQELLGDHDRRDGPRPHITIVHPRTSERGPAALRDLAGWRPGSVVVARQFALTATTVGGGMEIEENFPLRGARRRLVVAVALARNDHILLGRRSRYRSWYPGVWDLPGGHIEPAESPVVAGLREAREEVGVGIEPTDLRHVDTVIGADYELIVFTATRWSGTPVNAAADEHDEIAWFRRTEVDDLDLAAPVISRIVERCLA